MQGNGDGDESAAVEALASALDAILTELVAYRLSRLPSGAPLQLRRPAMTTDDKRRALIARINEDPFEGAMLFALRGIGEGLFRCGGTPLMHVVLSEVAARDRENESRRLSPADALWDGIGDESDLWAS
jgi:hypothetical protein